MRSQCGFSVSATPPADRHRHVLVEGAVVAERLQVELQRLRLDQPFVRHVVDDQDAEIRLAGHRADRGELGEGEAGEVLRARPAGSARGRAPPCRGLPGSRTGRPSWRVLSLPWRRFYAPRGRRRHKPPARRGRSARRRGPGAGAGPPAVEAGERDVILLAGEHVLAGHGQFQRGVAEALGVVLGRRGAARGRRSAARRTRRDRRGCGRSSSRP